MTSVKKKPLLCIPLKIVFPLNINNNNNLPHSYIRTTKIIPSATLKIICVFITSEQQTSKERYYFLPLNDY